MMAGSAKNNLKDKLEDGELDLSMMQYNDVPVKEIEQLGGKVVSLNLSHNLLTILPANFPLQLSHITKLDLSKNMLSELPENFGQFRNLKSLDLYANKLEKLPVSFAQLRSLKWLDLKDNPLCPALRQAAGDCITPNDCSLCAKKVVALLQSYETQLVRERQRLLEEEMAARREQERLEEQEREKLRQEKRAAKERRREEARQREAETRRETDLKARHEMQVNGNGSFKDSKKSLLRAGNGYGDLREDCEDTGSWLGSLLIFLAGLAVAGLGLSASLIWIYTEGKLDSKSVSSALPVIQADVEDYLMSVGIQTVKWYQEAEKISKPYITSAITGGKSAWNEGGKHLRDGAKYVEENYGDLLHNIAEQIKATGRLAWEYLVQTWSSILPYLKQAWETSKPYFQQLGKIIIEKSSELTKYLQDNFPVYMEMVSQALADLVQFTVKTWQKITDTEMDSAVTLTALIDFYNLKKEGKVALVNGEPCLTANKTKVDGLFPILSHLNSKQNILGQSPLEQALVRQWITFQFGCIDINDKKETEGQLRKLNESLRNKCFIAGNTLTAADVLLYHGIHQCIAEMTYQEKDKLIHLSRWFRNLQQNAKLRRGKPLVTFSRTKLY